MHNFVFQDHACRSEGLELARELDHKAAQAWVGHPYFDVVDNSTDFETKVCRMIQVSDCHVYVYIKYILETGTHCSLTLIQFSDWFQCVCQKLGIDARDRLQTNARKVKFLVKGPLPTQAFFPSGYQDFAVVHDYLQTNAPKMQARLRKRGQKVRAVFVCSYIRSGAKIYTMDPVCPVSIIFTIHFQPVFGNATN